jgi:xanthine dehydrogenase accessory factor
MSKDLYRHILGCLARRQRLVLATVVARSGSGPREAGASMAVKDGGESLGTVGGGLLEAQVLAAAQEVLRSTRPVCLTFSLTAKEVAAGGMLCGGRVEVLVDVLEVRDPGILQIFEKIVAAQEEGRGVWLIRSIRPEQSERNVSSVSVAPESALPVVRSLVRTGLGLMDEDNLDAGSLDMTDLTINTLKHQRRRAEVALIASGGVRYLLQPVVLPDRVIIAGAGHVAQELATLCHFLGLRTVVIDDRREFAGRERFPAAGEIVISPDSFQDCFLGMEIDGDCRIVIVTRGHEHDRNVLAQALRTGAGYIGMIGSRRKRDAIYRSLRGEGFSPEDLARVHCPIGIAIGARTPAEIAVSIAAELIALRAGKEISPVLIPG